MMTIINVGIANQSRVLSLLPNLLGIDIKETRKYIYEIKINSGEVVLSILQARYDLILNQIKNSGCEIGIIGKDKITEYGDGKVHIIQELPISKCELRFGIPEGYTIDLRDPELNIITSYPKIVQTYLDENNFQAKINSGLDFVPAGSVEIYPKLMDGNVIIADITETGNTMRANGLVVGDVIFTSSLCLCTALNRKDKSFSREVKGFLELFLLR